MNALKYSILLLVLGLTLGCQTVYYSAMEKVGVHKRDILVDRVKEAQASQQEAQVEFQSALEKFQSVVKVDGGELQTAYQELNDKYQDSKSAAESVTSHINKVEDVAEALFEEWENELEQYTSANLKAQSANKLKETRLQYSKLLKSMRQAESKMPPFLSALNDNVLYLKHNLNAKAIGALKGELTSIERNVKGLIKDINKSIEQSNRFIQSLE